MTQYEQLRNYLTQLAEAQEELLRIVAPYIDWSKEEILAIQSAMSAMANDLRTLEDLLETWRPL